MKELLEKKRSEKEAFQEEFLEFETMISRLEKGSVSSILTLLRILDIDKEDDEYDANLNTLRDELEALTAQANEAEKQRNKLIAENAEKKERFAWCLLELELIL